MAFYAFMVSIVRGRSPLLVVGVLGLCGCATVGPQSITAGRGVYAEVINRTEDEQILNALVRMRYEETFSMITVASVTASLRFSARANADFAIGDVENYAGNLVPLSAGVAYEESPTISYVPLTGEDFMRRMLSPLSTSEWILISKTARHKGRVFRLGVSRVNGLRNPLPGEEPPSPEFTRFVELYDRLQRASVLDLVRAPETQNDYLLDIHGYEDGYSDSVREFLNLLGIKVKLDGTAILLPIHDAIGRSTSAVNIKMRSAYDILRVFGTGIEIPPAHLEAGIVESLTSAPSEDAQFVSIRSSEENPGDATVQIRFRDRWFYIDATDTSSKQGFAFLRTFIGMRLADPGAAQAAPVLTVPVK